MTLRTVNNSNDKESAKQHKAEGVRAVLQDARFSHQPLVKVKEGAIRVPLSGVEEGSGYHEGHKIASGYANNSYESLVSYGFLGCEMSYNGA